MLVNWNGWRDTLESLESLFRIDYQSFRVVVSDNDSQDGSLDYIKAWADNRLNSFPPPSGKLGYLSWPPVAKPVAYAEYGREEAERGGDADLDPPLTLIKNGRNLGFAGGNNVGLRYAIARRNFRYVWLLNNDTVVDPFALTRLMERMELQPAVGMCGSTLRLYHAPDKIQALGGGLYCRWIGLPWHYGRFAIGRKVINQPRAEVWMNYVEGASMFVSRQFIEEIGLMCEDYFLYFEETDWAIRAKGRFKIAYASQSIVYHKVGGSIGTSSNPVRKSYLCDYFNIRNRIFFTRRFYPVALPSVYLVILGALLLRLFSGKWDRVMMILKIFFGYNDRQHKMISAYRRGP
ncbi:MAG: glycosyltransferase family 2 protein [Deltaproteobacteria bacterium]